MRQSSSSIAVVGALMLSACAQHAVMPAGESAQPPAAASAVFTMHWPVPKSGRVAHPEYISHATLSLSIQINNAQSLGAVVNNPGTGGTSKVTIDAPVGTDVFLIKAYDQLDAQGAVLSQAQVSQKIVAGKANTVSAVLNGVVASIALALSNPSPIAGTAATSSLTVTAKDADGNVIVGPGDYDQAIHLSDSDAFATSLSGALVIAPGSALTLSYNGKPILSAVITASAAGAPSSSVTFSPTPHVYEYQVPTASGRPGAIGVGPDGALWFTELSANKIGRVTTGGSFSEFAVPTAASQLGDITAGPDGALWFTEESGNKIGRITTGGSISEFLVPTSSSGPLDIAVGSDGALWFTETTANKVGRITTGGSISEFAVPTANSAPVGIAAGPDGALWFTELFANQIARVSTGGALKEYAVTTLSSGPTGISAGPDGAMWFTEGNASRIGRITTGGSISEFATVLSSDPSAITAGPDEAMWFTEPGASKIGRITTGGSISEFALPAAEVQLGSITTGPDGALWFAEGNANQIGRLVY